MSMNICGFIEHTKIQKGTIISLQNLYKKIIWSWWSYVWCEGFGQLWSYKARNGGRRVGDSHEDAGEPRRNVNVVDVEARHGQSCEANR